MHFELVAQGQPDTRHEPLEQPRRMTLVQNDGLPALHPREDLPRVRPESADYDTIVDRVRAQHLVRSPVPPCDDQLDLILSHHPVIAPLGRDREVRRTRPAAVVVGCGVPRLAEFPR